MDIFLLVVVCGCSLAGLFMGAVRMATATIAVVAAVLAGRFAGHPAAQLLGGAGEPGQTAQVVGVALVALVTGVLVLVAGRGVRKGLEALKLGWLDRIAGALLAGAASVALLAVLLALSETGGYRPGSPWATRLSEAGRTVLALRHKTATSSTSPSSTPTTATRSGQHPE